MINLKPTVLKNYFVDLTLEQVLKRLGYNKFKTKIDTRTENSINELIKESKILVEPAGIFKLVDIIIKEEEILFPENNYIIKNENFKKHILKNNGDKLILLCGTIGEKINQKIEFYLKNSENEKAVIVDAIGSEFAENNIEYIETVSLMHYKKYVYKSNFRFSIGYGNLELYHQKLFDELLHISDIGLSLNKNFLLIPEKSITAFLTVKSL